MAETFIERAKRLLPRATQSWWLAHSIRTGVAAAVSLAVAQLCRLHEAYWAPITTLIVMQSTLGVAWAMSKQRFIGTALGTALGALLASYFKPGNYFVRPGNRFTWVDLRHSPPGQNSL